MITAWTKHLKTEEEKKKFEQSLQRAKWVFDHLLQMIRDSKASVEAQEISPKAYDSPNWAYKQAHANGYKQCLADFTKLITLDPKDKTNG